jgi:thiol-disulfide isomerase/thioredoxin
MRVRTRWLIAALIVTAAVAVAVWPRSDDPPAPVAANLSAERAAAALAGCSTGTPVGALSGTKVECLADGKIVDLAGVLGGKPALINVWATWCSPCREELPVLADYTASPGAISVIGLVFQSPPKDTLELLTSLGVHFANVLDTDGAATRALRIPDALPASYVIGSDGSVHFVNDPRLFRSVESVREAVARYVPLNGSGRP